MRQLFHQASAPPELGWVGGSITTLFLVVLVSWTVWAFWPSRRHAMEQAAQMPFDDGGEA